MFSLGLGRFPPGRGPEESQGKEGAYEVSPRPFRRAAVPPPLPSPVVERAPLDLTRERWPDDPRVLSS